MERTLWFCHAINAETRLGITPPSGTYQSCPEVGGSFHAHDKEVGGAEKLFILWETPSKVKCRARYGGVRNQMQLAGKNEESFCVIRSNEPILDYRRVKFFADTLCDIAM